MFLAIGEDDLARRGQVERCGKPFGSGWKVDGLHTELALEPPLHICDCSGLFRRRHRCRNANPENPVNQASLNRLLAPWTSYDFCLHGGDRITRQRHDSVKHIFDPAQARPLPSLPVCPTRAPSRRRATSESAPMSRATSTGRSASRGGGWSPEPVFIGGGPEMSGAAPPACGEPGQFAPGTERLIGRPTENPAKLRFLDC